MTLTLDLIERRLIEIVFNLCAIAASSGTVLPAIFKGYATCLLASSVASASIAEPSPSMEVEVVVASSRKGGKKDGGGGICGGGIGTGTSYGADIGGGTGAGGATGGGAGFWGCRGGAAAAAIAAIVSLAEPV
ncbi:unnamed protein product [Closterium sp. NIES-53]